MNVIPIVAGSVLVGGLIFALWRIRVWLSYRGPSPVTHDSDPAATVDHSVATGVTPLPDLNLNHPSHQSHDHHGHHHHDSGVSPSGSDAGSSDIGHHGGHH